MKKPIVAKWLKGVLGVLSLLFFTQSSWASHLVGGDLHVDKIDSNRYEITLNYFFDCDGNRAAFNATQQVDYSSANCNISKSTTLDTVQGTGKDIAPVCNSRTSSCNGGSTKGIERYIFKDTITLSQCSDWVFSWSNTARNNAITTLQQPPPFQPGLDLYLEAELNNKDFPDNNVPEFTNRPLAFVCKGQDFVYNQGAVDPDGDSLRYSLYTPKTGPNSTVTYQSGFSASQPLKSSTPFTIDSATGDISFNASQIDVSVIGVKVEEFDTSGTLKSVILRDIQLIVNNCSSPNAPQLPGLSNSKGSFDSANENFDTTVCPGQAVTFYVNASDPDPNDSLFMSWNKAVTGANFSVINDGTNNPTGKFTWTPPNPSAGQGIERNTFTVNLRDDNCPYFTTISRGYVINVVPSKTVNLGDTAYVACDDSLKLKPVVKGASADSNLTFDWSTDQKGDSIYIQEPGTYAVTVKDSGNCPITDSIRVLPSLNPSYQITSSFAANRGCVTDSVQFSDSSRSEKAVVNRWDWDFGDGDTSDLQNPNHKFSDTGNYDVQLIIADTNGCQDTLNQTIAIDAKPEASFTLNKACSRESTVFTDQSAVDKGRIFSYQWDFGDGDSSSKRSPNHVYDTGAQYTTDLVVTTVGNCKDTARKNIRIHPKPIADFKSDNTCKSLGTQYTEQASIEPEDSITSYTWQLRPGLTSNKPNPKTIYNNTGTFNVSLKVTSSNNCGDTIVKPIKINVKPNLSTLSDTTFCKGDSVKLATSISPDENTTLFQDDFEGGITSSHWLSTSRGSAGNYCGTQQGNDALFFDGDGGDRKAITKDLDTRKADTVTFYFKYGTGNNNFPFSVNGCDAIEGGNNETVSVAFSTDGGSSWNTLQTLAEGNYSQSGFKKVALSIPGSAQTASTRFRWKQASYDNCNSGFFGTRCFDNWAIDNVKINNRVDYQFAWQPGNGFNDTSLLSPKVKTTTANTYTIAATDTAFNCTVKDSVKLTPQTITADFKSTAPVCEYEKAQYTDQSTIQNGKLSASDWSFGDGDSASVVNPDHRFPSTGNYNVQLVRESQIGCKDSITQADSVFKQPTADFTFDTACLGEATNFTDQAFVSTDTVSQYTWQFGSLGSSSKANPTFTFPRADSFRVTQVATSSKGCADTVFRYVDVGGVPKPGFDNEAVCEAVPKPFTDSSSVSYDSLVQWRWRFGDGGSATSPNPTHTYDSNGNYNVSLTVTSNFNCKDSIQKIQPVNPKPVAVFNLADSAQCLRGNRFQMNNRTTIDSGKLSFTWTFGDSSQSSKAAPAKSFADTGTYGVTLVSQSQEGCADTSTTALTVHPMPRAGFSVNDGAQCLTGNRFQFRGKSTISKGSLSEDWYFGDGDSSGMASPVHTYQAFGNYQAQVVATSDKACLDTAIKRIRVNPKPKPSFSYNQDSAQCLKGNEYRFLSTSSIDTGNLNFTWQMGDGTQAFQDSAFHQYSNSGNYKVQLVARSDSGCIDSVFRKVTVHPMPQAAFSVSDTAQCLDPNQFNLKNNSSILKGNLDYRWQFGDGTSSVSESPQVSYDSSRQYTVQLVAESRKGCLDTAYQALTVHPEPQAAFQVNDLSQCLASNQFQLTDQTQLRNGSLTYEWRMGDGTTLTKANPAHRYSAVDTYQVSQRVTSNKGCLDTALAKLYTNPMPRARVTVNNPDQCLDPNLFRFTNNSTISQGGLAFSWDFGDSTTAKQAQPTHSYDSAGNYEPFMIAKSDSGCRDTARISLTVNPQTNVAFGVEDSLQCQRGHRFSFRNESNSPTADMDFFWFFGDGNTGRAATISHTYDTTGAFDVRLATSTADGCRDTLTKTVFVKPHPDAQFQTNRGCAGQALSFDDQSRISRGTITQWQYQFGDGGSAQQPNPTYTYAKGATYEVALTVTSEFGCSDTTSQQVKIYRTPGPPKVVKASTTPSGTNVLHWNPAQSAIPEFYKLERAVGNGPFTKLAVLNPEARTFVDTAVDVDANLYDYRIQMVDTCRNEGPFNRPPHRPIQLEANEGKGEPELDWTDYRGWPVQFYQVQITNPEEEGFQTIGTYQRVLPSIGQLTDTVSTLKPGKLCYRVVGVKADPDTTIRTTSNVSCIDPTIRLFVPNAFSPNGDGYNDRFRVQGTYLTNVTVRVFNRWGEKVYESRNPEDGWDGTYNGEKLPTGPYTYIITAKGANGEFLQRDGIVTLIR